eukprot:TRINITY_DN93754_c0_g1_i1.p1 TRINITY_DN93754_c0_g1~~TRINITY_DN93754_c0_g1_i1.p1  ORF type:complete len:264 (-),score=50.22 TRINITY_DN93754_c0_g1_i1:21-773(-)
MAPTMRLVTSLALLISANEVTAVKELALRGLADIPGSQIVGTRQVDAKAALEQCCKYVTTLGVQANSYGSMPDTWAGRANQQEKEWWRFNSCDNIVGGVSAPNCKSAMLQMQSESPVMPFNVKNRGSRASCCSAMHEFSLEPGDTPVDVPADAAQWWESQSCESIVGGVGAPNCKGIFRLERMMDADERREHRVAEQLRAAREKAAHEAEQKASEEIRKAKDERISQELKKEKFEEEKRRTGRRYLHFDS